MGKSRNVVHTLGFSLSLLLPPHTWEQGGGDGTDLEPGRRESCRVRFSVKGWRVNISAFAGFSLLQVGARRLLEHPFSWYCKRREKTRGGGGHLSQRYLLLIFLHVRALKAALTFINCTGPSIVSYKWHAISTFGIKEWILSVIFSLDHLKLKYTG